MRVRRRPRLRRFACFAFGSLSGLDDVFLRELGKHFAVVVDEPAHGMSSRNADNRGRLIGSKDDVPDRSGYSVVHFGAVEVMREMMAP